MDLWDMLGVSRQVAVPVAAGALALSVLAVLLFRRRSRGNERTQIDLNSH